jgi:GNAT superfamily N-acetyltransferase
MNYIRLTKENIDSEHICCAFSDKKCKQSYQMKKDWLKKEFENGYIFTRLDERAKVFIEYGPAEKAWVPVSAPDYLMIGCFWVSGKYKSNGHGKHLLNEAVETAKIFGKKGLVTIVGKKKFHFMNDTKWLLKQGFEVCETIMTGFSLISLDLQKNSSRPFFNDCVKTDSKIEKKGCTVYYSNRCPYAEYHVINSLEDSCRKRNIPLKTIKFESMEQAQSSPTPATIFSLYLDGKFITTDISACMDSRFDKITGFGF